MTISQEIVDKIRLAAKSQEAAMIDFTQNIVRIPSLSGQEADVASVITQEMQELGYDAVWTDDVGNVIGKITGGDGPTILLNGHMDIVDPGPSDAWSYPPFSAQIVDDELWGRGSVDMKGPVASMIYAVSLFKRLSLKPRGDVFMTVPVMEEVGGIGTKHLVTHLQANAAICGEPSNNTIKRGHRGRIELNLKFPGNSVHASMPHLAHNPHYDVAAFLAQLPTLVMAQDPILGASTVAPTLYQTDQESANVTPGEISLTLDWRNIAHETADDIITKIENQLVACLGDALAQQVIIGVARRDMTTYTGLTDEHPLVFPSYLLADDDPQVIAALVTLAKVSGRPEVPGIWDFATDGGHLMANNIPTIGFGPGDDQLPHTSQERISLTQMKEALVSYTALTFSLAEAAL
ncbi:MAG: M20/M25/M40 family metallo-hydrolase [Chloroflexota bacterium]